MSTLASRLHRGRGRNRPGLRANMAMTLGALLDRGAGR